MEELEQEELDEQLLKVGPSAAELPNPPVAEPSRPGTISEINSLLYIWYWKQIKFSQNYN